MTEQSGGRQMDRPVMVNGVWPEERRSDAEAAAAEIGRLGEIRTAFSPQPEQHTPEYGDGGVIRWIKGHLGVEDGDEPVGEPPVVLRTWPPPDMRDQVAQLMDRMGAERINCWGGPVETNRDESLEAIRRMEEG